MAIFFKKIIVLLIICFFATQQLKSANYYWVGGLGNWSDINHWAQSSGGSSLHTVVPQISDNVFFDNNSGFNANDSINVDVAVATCKNFVWSTTILPNYKIGGNVINIYGSIILQKNVAVSNVLVLKSTVNETITSNGAIYRADIVINGTGAFNLSDSLHTIGSCSISSGVFNTNTHKLIVGSFIGSNTASVNINNTTVAAKNWSLKGVNTSVQAANSQLLLTNSFEGQQNHIYNSIVFNDVNAANSFGGSVLVNTAIFISNGVINGNNTFGTLQFSAGKNYVVASSSVQKITNLWQSNTSSCSGLMEIFASNIANATFDIAGTAAVQLSNAIVKKITATGSNLPIVATNSFDFGNNNNFLFPVATSKVLYWVGGAGNWNDATHWSTINNGVYPSITGCIPTPIDDVVFNSNAGFAPQDSVILNLQNQYCRNIVFQGALNNPTITNNKLSVFGSFTLQPNMVYNVSQTNFLSNNNNETITCSGTAVNSDLEFEGNAEWLLMDELNVNLRAIKLKKGTITTNSNIVRGATYVGTPLSGATVKLNLGASQIYMRNSWSYTGAIANTILNAGTSHIHLGGYFNGAFNHIYYNITFTDTLITASLDGSIKANQVIFNGSANISGNNQFNSLTFSPAKVYILDENSNQTIVNNWNATTPICSGLMEIKSTSGTTQAFITLLPSTVVNASRVLFNSINIGGIPSLIAPNSFDFGNNVNIVFPVATGTTYYWVGGAGNWSDNQHWSTINNGVYPSTTGCVPTPLDNIIFNSNSGFTLTSNIVNANLPNLYCNNITWQGVATNSSISGIGSELNVLGAVQLQNTANLFLQNINLMATTTTVTINTNNALISANFYLKGSATWQLQNALIIDGTIFFQNGNLITNNFSIEANAFSGMPVQGSINASLGNSTILVESWTYTNNTNATIAGGNSNIYTKSFNGSPNHIYHNIIIDTVGNMSGGIIAHKVWFKNSGRLNGDNVIDSLVFTFGKIYTLQKNATQTVKKIWYPNGNPCFITRIISSETGTQANVKLDFANATYDYIYLKDINAASSLTPITANSHSTNDGNNTNFTFVPYNNNGIIGLGNDTVLNCTNFPLTLLTNNFYPNPVTTFVWQNASTNNNFIVQDSGKYNVQVNYGEGCIVNDTIKVTRTNNAGLRNIQASICNNQNYTLPNGTIVQTAGTYVDTVTNAIGCDSIITTMLSIKASSIVNETKVICPGTSYTLPNGQVVTQPGLYTTAFTNVQGCDSIIKTTIQLQSLQHLQIMPVQPICEGKSTQLLVTGANSYTWTPSSTLSSTNIKNPIASPTVTTLYSVTVTDSICNSQQVLQTQVLVNPLPSVQLQKTNDLDCNKLTTTLSATSNMQLYQWLPAIGLSSTSQSSVIAQPTSTTMYTVKVTDVLGCTNQDSVQVNVIVRVPDLEIPNIFTPNNDGINDCFGVKFWGSVSQYELNIYNRWGQKVYGTNNLQSCWNGIFQNKIAPLGTYVYYIKAYDECTQKHFIKKGTVVLVR
jgi:gliding motility-associated-like protein